MTRTAAKPEAIALAIVLLAGLVLRTWDFPSRYELRDVDELGYVSGGLLLWEGITPGLKMAPAGIQTWVGWCYCAARSAFNLLHRESEGPAPALLRAYHAIDKSLFDTYRDISFLKQINVALLLLISLFAIWAAFQTGFHRAGIPGGLLSGGLTAALPIFVQLSGMAKPYMAAWGCAIIAHYFSVTRTGRVRWAGSALFMGLAISSRIEMLLFLPILLWEFWNEKEPIGFSRTALRVVLLTAVVTLLISPWLATNLIGNLRTIATVRFSGQETVGTLLRDYIVHQGLGPVMVLILAGLAAGPAINRRPGWVLLIIYAVLFATMLRPSLYGLRHHGAVLAAAIAISPIALAPFWKAHSKSAAAFVFALLFIPVTSAVSAIRSDLRGYVSDAATTWVETHVPGGTTVYLCPTFYDPLPTVESADALWSDVANSQAWQKKFERGVGGYEMGAARIPRALSEENLIQEKGNRRRWFILGGADWTQTPRYRIKLISGGSPFDLTSREAVSEFKRTGGVLIWRESRMDDAPALKKELGTPQANWMGRNGRSVSVYYMDPASTASGK